MQQIPWNGAAQVIMSRDRTLYSGTLAMCVLHFRDGLSSTRQIACYISLQEEMVNGKASLGPEEIYQLITAVDLPQELTASRRI
jgi:hypothetical protein